MNTLVLRIFVLLFMTLFSAHSFSAAEFSDNDYESGDTMGDNQTDSFLEDMSSNGDLVALKRNVIGDRANEPVPAYREFAKFLKILNDRNWTIGDLREFERSISSEVVKESVREAIYIMELKARRKDEKL